MHYFLIEAINIYDNILDVNHISIIRGGSNLLKQAIEQISKNYSHQLTTLSSGASSGFFQIREHVDIPLLTESICNFLNQHPYAIFTFVIEHCQADDLLSAKEQLIKQLRFSQTCCLSIAPDTSNDEHRYIAEACSADGYRRAVSDAERKFQGGENSSATSLSLSALTRLDIGRALRQDQYYGSSADSRFLHDYHFSDNFELLTSSTDYPQLNNKMAVIYIDGNKFSSIQRAEIEQADPSNRASAQQAFDETIQNHWNDLLFGYLKQCIDKPDMVSTFGDKKQKYLKFETLLWGGDEMLFILPAHAAFSFIEYFFTASKDWKTPENTPLTNSLGMVICSAKSPIRNIEALARSLADTVKDNLGSDRIRKNGWDYLILKSLDYPSNSHINSFVSKRYEHIASKRHPLLTPANDWTAINTAIRQLIGEELLSRRQLYNIIHRPQDSTLSWQQLIDKTEQNKKDIAIDGREKAEIRMLQLLTTAQIKQLDKYLKVLADQLFNIDIEKPEERIWLWLHLIESWDLFEPICNTAEKELAAK